MRLEKQIEEAVCAFAREQGVLVRKYTSPSCQGVPDRIFWVPGGKPLVIEFKRPKGIMSPIQHREIVAMRKLGYRVLVIDNVEAGIDAIRRVLPKA